jgi:hypothetical protein
MKRRDPAQSILGGKRGGDWEAFREVSFERGASWASNFERGSNRGGVWGSPRRRLCRSRTDLWRYACNESMHPTLSPTTRDPSDQRLRHSRFCCPSPRRHGGSESPVPTFRSSSVGMKSPPCGSADVAWCVRATFSASSTRSRSPASKSERERASICPRRRS